ncbi:MAG: hypothetical protein ABSB87_00355 [Terriglobales bacterium]|jgi:hypothetical protein
MADFIFRVDSVQLSDHQKEKIASAIQGAVLTELARLDLQGGQTKGQAPAPGSGASGAGTFLYRPHNWYGGLLLKAVEAAKAVESNFSVTNKAGNRSENAA